MFKLEPISTTNIISVLQIVLIVGGFYFSWRSLKVGAESLDTASKSLALSSANAQAQLYNHILVQGRELQFKFMDILGDPSAADTIAAKQQLFVGIVISYYAGAFELRRVLNMPETTKSLMDAEIKELMREKIFKDKWGSIYLTKRN